uniref:Uncharacterized protein n=1 Tax=Parascaris univalens TaxID=6257 RepID=A0A915C6D0_PARUN
SLPERAVTPIDMGAALLLILAVIIGTGVAYHLGYLDPYIAQAQEQLKAKQG